MGSFGQTTDWGPTMEYMLPGLEQYYSQYYPEQQEGFLPGEPAPGTTPETTPIGEDWGQDYEWEPEVTPWTPTAAMMADPEYQAQYQDLLEREQQAAVMQEQLGSMELMQVTDPRTGEVRWEWQPIEQMATRQAGVYGSPEEYQQAQQQYEGQEAARQERQTGMLEQLGYSPEQLKQQRSEFQQQWQGREPQPQPQQQLYRAAPTPRTEPRQQQPLREYSRVYKGGVPYKYEVGRRGERVRTPIVSEAE